MAAKVSLPSFYRLPATLRSTKPGTLIKYQRISDPGVTGTTYRVMYVSRSATDKPIVVTGLVLVPTSPAPVGGYPVVTWGHGTNGMAEQCAPSLDPAMAVPLVNNLLSQGWVVTASDYQGEGTPGPLPYLVGDLAARNTIDIVRAADHLRAAHASKNYVIWGHSEGGQTAMFGLKIADSYAPDLKLKGVVAGAPPSQFSLIYSFLKTSTYRYYLFMAVVGFNAAYGSRLAPLSAVLTKTGLKLVPIVDKGCADYVQTVLDHYTLAQLLKINPYDVPSWKKLLSASDPASITSPSSAPLLMIQGSADQEIPPVSTQILETQLCKVGQNVERWIYPGQSHAGVIVPSDADMIRWISDRFANGPNPDSYQPTGLAGVQVTTCSEQV